MQEQMEGGQGIARLKDIIAQVFVMFSTTIQGISVRGDPSYCSGTRDLYRRYSQIKSRQKYKKLGNSGEPYHMNITTPSHCITALCNALPCTASRRSATQRPPQHNKM